jgi:hypothetical protein
MSGVCGAVRELACIECTEGVQVGNGAPAIPNAHVRSGLYGIEQSG